MKDACDAINPVFFHYITTKLPYVVMKYAMSMDGKIAAYTGKSQWITGEAARQHVQETRSWLKGIMVGCNTVLQDDPALTCRIEGGRNPVRIVCDSHLRIPLDCQLVQTAVDVPTIVATLDGASDKAKELQRANVQILQCKEKDGRIDLYDLMVQLGAQDIDGILLEGGGTLNEQALAQDIVQEVQVYIAPKIIGGAEAKTPVEGKGVPDPMVRTGLHLTGWSRSETTSYFDIERRSGKYVYRNHRRGWNASCHAESIEIGKPYD